MKSLDIFIIRLKPKLALFKLTWQVADFKRFKKNAILKMTRLYLGGLK